MRLVAVAVMNNSPAVVAGRRVISWRASLRRSRGALVRRGSGCRAGGVCWLEDDHGGLRWPPRGVGVEVLVDIGPAGPQPLALVCLGPARTDPPRPVAGLGGGVGMSLQVQPPRGLGRTPPVHRHRDQVAAVLDV